ncbi:MAG: hypothetical protein [Microvirus sp.]|nr:MAG: hypothetical protein [Microvirus sp.]
MKKSSSLTQGERVYRGHNTYTLKKEDMEKPKGRSMTVPNDAYTIADIFTKFRQGIPLAIQRESEYDDQDITVDDYGMSELHRADPIDREIIKGSISSQLQKLEQKIETIKNSKSKKYKAPDHDEPEQLEATPKETDADEDVVAKRKKDVSGSGDKG